MEKLKKVESFSELKIGMLVVIKDCRVCRKPCRGMLVKYDYNHLFFDLRRAPAFYRLPNCDHRAWVTALAVEQGRLYRVEDGLEDDSAETEKMDGIVRELQGAMINLKEVLKAR
jgi:hypothetical protein